MCELIEIPGYSDYSINRLGQIYSIKTKKYLQPSINSSGYYCVSLIRDRKLATKNIHRLLAELFIPNPNKWKWVSFLDCNKENFAIENLAWVEKKTGSRALYKNKFDRH